MESPHPEFPKGAQEILWWGVTLPGVALSYKIVPTHNYLLFWPATGL